MKKVYMVVPRRATTACNLVKSNATYNCFVLSQSRRYFMNVINVFVKKLLLKQITEYENKPEL